MLGWTIAVPFVPRRHQARDRTMVLGQCAPSKAKDLLALRGPPDKVRKAIPIRKFVDAIDRFIDLDPGSSLVISAHPWRCKLASFKMLQHLVLVRDRFFGQSVPPENEFALRGGHNIVRAPAARRTVADLDLAQLVQLGQPSQNRLLDTAWLFTRKQLRSEI